MSHGLSLFGRQAAWRPVCIRGGVVKMVVGTVLAVAELWLRFLGSVWGVQARSSSCFGGRGAIVVVSSRRLVVLCILLVICDVLLGLCMRGSSSVVKLLGGRGAIVVVLSRRLVALRILLLSCGCVFLGSVCGVRARSSSCLAAEVQSWWCCQDG